jgi:HD-like signal output (HDOD) protein/ActR/RegA family two-component response regulator
MKKRILFVDDEPNVLGGLRRMLRPLHQEWTTEFAEGGPQALAVLDKGPFDVVVSDMRMPGMTGAQLLEEVRQRFPHMVRIILTGQCDEESGLRALRVAHQMLYKPCDAESLKATVARTCSLGELLSSPALQTIVTRQGSIPSLPTLYQEVLKELDSETPSLDKVAAIVGKDMGMVAKILHVVNSSFFGLRREITSPSQAVMLLGLETMRVLVLAVGIFSTFRTKDHPDLSLAALQKHGDKTSVLARAIAKAEAAPPRDIEHAAMAGLLHDIGKLILLDSGPEAYPDMLARAAAAKQPLWEAERAAFGASHSEVGAFLLGLWGLPMPIVEAVAWHHRPSDCPARSFCPLTAVHVANALISANGSTGEPQIDHAYLQRLNLLERLPYWQKLVLVSA